MIDGILFLRLITVYQIFSLSTAQLWPYSGYALYFSSTSSSETVITYTTDSGRSYKNNSLARSSRWQGFVSSSDGKSAIALAKNSSSSFLLFSEYDNINRTWSSTSAGYQSPLIYGLLNTTDTLQIMHLGDNKYLWTSFNSTVPGIYQVFVRRSTRSDILGIAGNSGSTLVRPLIFLDDTIDPLCSGKLRTLVGLPDGGALGIPVSSPDKLLLWVSGSSGGCRGTVQLIDDVDYELYSITINTLSYQYYTIHVSAGPVNCGMNSTCTLSRNSTVFYIAVNTTTTAIVNGIVGTNTALLTRNNWRRFTLPWSDGLNLLASTGSTTVYGLSTYNTNTTGDCVQNKGFTLSVSTTNLINWKYTGCVPILPHSMFVRIDGILHITGRNITNGGLAVVTSGDYGSTWRWLPVPTVIQSIDNAAITDEGTLIGGYIPFAGGPVTITGMDPYYHSNGNWAGMTYWNIIACTAPVSTVVKLLVESLSDLLSLSTRGDPLSVAVLGMIGTDQATQGWAASFQMAWPLRTMICRNNAKATYWSQYSGSDGTINDFFNQLASGKINPKVIVIGEAGWWDANANGIYGMTLADRALVDVRGKEIADFVNTGGGLFSANQIWHADLSPGFGWLTSLIPTIVPIQGISYSSAITRTAAGIAMYSTLTDADLTSPWHQYFVGDFGSLVTLATGILTQQNNAVVPIIIGGKAVIIATGTIAQTIIFPKVLQSGSTSLMITLTAALGGSASSDLPLSYVSLTSTVCSVDNTMATVKMLTIGTCTVRADQNGNEVYAKAASVTASITVLQASATATGSATPTATSTATSTSSGTRTSSATSSPSSVSSVSPSASSRTSWSASASTSASASASGSGSASVTASSSITASVSGSASASFTSVPTYTVTSSAQPTISSLSTSSATESAYASLSSTLSNTVSSSVSSSASSSAVPTLSISATTSASGTGTSSASSSASATSTMTATPSTTPRVIDDVFPVNMNAVLFAFDLNACFDPRPSRYSFVTRSRYTLANITGVPVDSIRLVILQCVDTVYQTEIYSISNFPLTHVVRGGYTIGNETINGTLANVTIGRSVMRLQFVLKAPPSNDELLMSTVVLSGNLSAIQNQLSSPELISVRLANAFNTPVKVIKGGIEETVAIEIIWPGKELTLSSNLTLKNELRDLMKEITRIYNYQRNITRNDNSSSTEIYYNVSIQGSFTILQEIDSDGIRKTITSEKYTAEQLQTILIGSIVGGLVALVTVILLAIYRRKSGKKIDSTGKKNIQLTAGEKTTANPFITPGTNNTRGIQHSPSPPRTKSSLNIRRSHPSITTAKAASIPSPDDQPSLQPEQQKLLVSFSPVPVVRISKEDGDKSTQNIIPDTVISVPDVDIRNNDTVTTVDNEHTNTANNPVLPNPKNLTKNLSIRKKRKAIVVFRTMMDTTSPHDNGSSSGKENV